MTILGIENLLRNPGILGKGGRLGLLYNQASVDRRFVCSAEVLAAVFPGRLTTLFGPQHGIHSTEQDNMIETEHSVHPELGVPVFSLYSETRQATRKMLGEVDTMVVDLQDVGTRVYTFAATVLYLMESCADAGIPVFILDRPNPVNGVDVEGHVLDTGYASFVGPHPIPMRHGMTLGELMKLYNVERNVGCDLSVVEMSDWNRNRYYDPTGLPWVLPSPNMPTVETAVVYPGQVALEGCNVSEGRGTTRPFELFGAPFIDPREVADRIEPTCLAGCALRPTEFRPTFNKCAGEVCRGFQIHVTDRELFRPFRFTVGLLTTLMRLYPSDFAWTDPPYEYEYERPPIDVIFGTDRIRSLIEQGAPIADIEDDGRKALDEFLKLRQLYLIYPG